MGHDEPTMPKIDRSPAARACLIWRRLVRPWSLAAVFAIVALGFAPVPAVLGATVTVNTVEDEDDVALEGGGAPDACSLREAIVAANTGLDYNGCIHQPDEDLDPDEIRFQIPGGGVHTIEVGDAVTGDLPDITASMTINGRSQGGGPGDPPRIAIVPSATTSGGLRGLYVLGIGGEVVTIDALAIGGFDFGIDVAVASEVFIYGSFIGLDPSGGDIGNVVGIQVSMVPDTTIGGPGAGQRNVIAFNDDDGIFVCDCGSGETIIQNNVIGLNPASTGPAPNGGNGVHILDAVNVTIGGSGANEGNVISANLKSGVLVEGIADDIDIDGNRIGTNGAGTAALGNAFDGIRVAPEPPADPMDPLGPGPSDVDIGDQDPGSGNLISGNLGHGVSLVNTGFDPGFPSDRSSGVEIDGNIIGLAANGVTRLQNGGSGVSILNGVFTDVGGPAAGEGNVISGNGQHGVTIVGELSMSTFVLGNRIGTTADGTAPVGNGGDGVNSVPDGVSEFGPAGVTVGDDIPGAGNIISGNGRHGVYLVNTIFDPVRLSESLVIHNLIGVNVNGEPLGNGRVGVLLEETNETVIFENFIANNGRAGVLVARADPSACGCLGPGDLVITNSIYNNQGPGIDMSATINKDPNAWTGDGVTPNDAPDDDQIQNHPVIETATTSVVGTVITGDLESQANVTYRVELFSIPGCDPPANPPAVGHGEGRTFLGAVDVATNGLGLGTFKVTAPTVPDGHQITATASHPDQETSEFSACKAVTTAAVLVAPTSGLTTTEAGGTAQFTVALSTLPSAPVQVTLTSGDTTEGTIPPAQATLTFTELNGTTPQVVTITGQPDAIADGNQTYSIQTGVASSVDLAYNGLNPPDVSVVNQDSPTIPTLTLVQPAPVTESTGASGSLGFTVNLSPASTQTVTANWQVVNGTATIGSDIEPADATGTVTFNPNDTSRQIVIRIIGDTLPEPTETFTLQLTTSNGAAIAVHSVTGTINDNDSPIGPCSPRPNIVMTTQRTGPDRLVVTFTAGSGTLKKIAFGSPTQLMQNAEVETIGPASVIQGFGVYTPQPNVTQQSFVVRRLVNNQPVMVTMVVEDGCGEWKTLVGNGPSPW